MNTTPTTRQLQIRLNKKEKEVTKLIAEKETLKRLLIESRITSAKESELKNSFLFFIIKKGLFSDYQEWIKLEITADILKEFK